MFDVSLPSPATLISYHIHFFLSSTFFIFFLTFYICLWNGENGIWTHAPLSTTYSLSRGAPSTSWVFLQLLIFTKYSILWILAQNNYYINNKNFLSNIITRKTERVGFEPTVPFGITGFQDQLLKPLGHLSKLIIYTLLSVTISARVSIALISFSVNNYFKIFLIFWSKEDAPARTYSNEAALSLRSRRNGTKFAALYRTAY